MSRTHRLFQLMQALRNHSPPVTAAVLAMETDVSERTLYRDIDALRGLGAVIDGTAGYGYALTEDPSLPPMMFNDEEIEALVLGLRDVQAIGDPALAKAAGNALAKLQARLPSTQAHRLKHAVLGGEPTLRTTHTGHRCRSLTPRNLGRTHGVVWLCRRQRHHDRTFN
jgi:predicted DNA-binding transcriptional regulator YafY